MSPSHAAQATTVFPEIPGIPAAEADLRALLAEALTRLEIDVVTVLRFDPASDHLVTMVTVSEHRVSAGQHRVPLGRGLAGKVAAARLPLALDNVADDDLLNPALYALGIRSVLALP